MKWTKSETISVQNFEQQSISLINTAARSTTKKGVERTISKRGESQKRDLQIISYFLPS